MHINTNNETLSQPSLVSVLIRTKDRLESLIYAVNSVLAQTYRPLQLIVVNDGGICVNSAVSELLSESSPQIDYKYERFIHAQGRSAAANKALELATGDYCLFLDDDDFIAPLHIEMLVSALRYHQDVIAVYSATECVKFNDDNELVSIRKIFAQSYDANQLAVENFLPIHSVLFDSIVIKKGARFNSELTVYEDWYFWLQLAAMGDMKLIPLLTAYYRTDISGVGEPGTDKDYDAELNLFLSFASELWTVNQKRYLLGSSKQLNKANKKLTQIYQEKDELDLLSLRQKKEILDLQDKLTKIESKENIFFEILKNKYGIYKRRFSIGLLLIKRAQFSELWNRSKNALLGKSTKCSFDNVDLKYADLKSYVRDGVNIMVTQHTIYIGRMLQSALHCLGFNNIKLLTKEPKYYEEKLHIVVCPQMYKKMPSLYIAYQMEQSVSSRWFTKEYFSLLENSLAILDYSFDNVKYLQEVGGLSYKQIYYMPVSNISGMKLSPDRVIEYDVVFYGDPNNSRRQRYLAELKKHFNVKVVSEVFGETLYQVLSKARVVVNIHYYENALLETTRVFECLSLGLHVVSEESSDQEQHKNLANVVDFVPIGDIGAMVLAIKERLSEPVISLIDLPDDLNNAAHYLGRVFFAYDLIRFEQLCLVSLPYQIKNQMMALSLPETYQRHRYFQIMHANVPIFTGLRHVQGWKGCALSYKFLCHNALKFGLKQLEICEDDADLDEAFSCNWSIAKSFLSQYEANNEWDVFCGLMADVSDQANILDVIDYQGIQFVVLDRMMSMVYNIYNHKAVRLIALWDDTNLDAQTNTIDRYLEKHRLRVVTTVPFLVGHLPDQHSTLWGFQNTQYDEMIYLSQQKLQKKVDDFVAKRKERRNSLIDKEESINPLPSLPSVGV